MPGQPTTIDELISDHVKKATSYIGLAAQLADTNSDQFDRMATLASLHQQQAQLLRETYLPQS